MPIKCSNTLRLAALALPLLVVSAGALARDIDRNDDRTTGSGTQLDRPTAPIGHRQPRATDMPTMSPSAEDDWINRVNRDTDRKLQICPGC